MVAEDINCNMIGVAFNMVQDLIKQNGCKMTCPGCTYTHLRIRRITGDDPLVLTELAAFHENVRIPLQGVELYPPTSPNTYPIENLVDKSGTTFAITDRNRDGYMLVRLETPGPVDRIVITGRPGYEKLIFGSVLEGLEGHAVRFTYPLDETLDPDNLDIPIR